MTDINKLLKSGLLDEDTKVAIQEALESKVKERLEEETDVLREEFGRRYEHDKKIMVEAADRMFNEVLEKELKEFHDERQQFVEAKVNYKKMIRNHAKTINTFAVSKLHEEINELRSDRKQLAKALMKFEKFAVQQLTSELNEFHIDKRELAETKVRLIREAKQKIGEARKDFIQRAALISEGFIEEQLKKELVSFRTDIKEARKNNFGRRLFEAFSAEFIASHASDGTQLKNFMNAIKERENKISEATTLIKRQNKALKKGKVKQRFAENRLVRSKKMNELLSPLPRDKKELMTELLANVDTKRLNEQYKKHIKYVLNESGVKRDKQSLTEGSESKFRKDVTGGQRVLNEGVDEDSEIQQNILTLRRLAGLNN